MNFARISEFGNRIDDLGCSCYKDVNCDGDPFPLGCINLSSAVSAED